jgi:hypothetical protein
VKAVAGFKLQQRDGEPDEALEVLEAAVPLAHVVQPVIQPRFAVS